MNFITIDHIVPRSRGGPDKQGNIALVHTRCNVEKADREPTACELLFGRLTREIMNTEPARRAMPFEPPWEKKGW